MSDNMHTIYRKYIQQKPLWGGGDFIWENSVIIFNDMEIILTVAFNIRENVLNPALNTKEIFLTPS
jgi:hypothetical protein